jgi:primary-amine oxidase
VLQRASVTELVVPYGDPTPAFFRRHPFDAGEFGLGLAANSLALGCDCLGEIRYLDAVVHNAAGAPTTIHNAICLHEEDVGVLWKHTEPDGTAHVRRSRRLVVSCFCTLGNYDYGFFWYFYQDGSIQFEAKLTGIVNTTAVPPGETSPYGTLMLPQVSAVHHQHFFNVRLDMAVDGERNSVVEVEARPEPLGPDNPYGNAFRAHETLLRTELAARRNAEPLRGRYWKVINPDVRNRMGQPVGYKLLPGENVLPLAHPTSSVGRRAGFLAHHLHVTPYAEDERYAPGDYPNQHPGGAGLPAWTGRDRVVEATDVVLWYTFGCTHIARLEEWPIMSVSTIGFMLKPVGFFDYNPAIDVPPPTAQHPACHSHCS